ncbi:MAG TPA: AI-2E family transporter [Thermoanaerobaculia bacterium]|nr:AI-2E family transporter [Thermoanaerobaculia bacterium]
MLQPVVPQPPEKPRPNIQRLRDLFQGPFQVRSMALVGLLVLASLYTLYFARAFVLPVILALLLSFVLQPLVRGLKKLRIPEGLGALVVLLALVGLLAFAAYELAGPALEWLDRAPGSMRRLEAKLRELKAPVERMSEATQRVEEITQVGEQGPRPVEVESASLGERLFQNLWDFSANAVVMLILLYFLLASGDLFLRKLVRIMPTLTDKKRAVEILRQVEDEVSAYLSTITLVNLVLGVAVGLAFYLLDMPNPVLWGLMAALLNYIPYLGAMVGVAIMAVVSFLTFKETGEAMLVPLAYLAINFVESYFLTPMVLGRRLTLNPVVIFIGLTFWGWIWGITGAIIAVPLLVIFKIICDHSEPLAPIGEFLGS